MTRPRFHLAFNVHDLAAARRFYTGVLGCSEGRSTDRWVDFDLHGHQLSAHLDPQLSPPQNHGQVDGHRVPMPHFGLIMAWDAWEVLAGRLREAGAEFLLEPQVRFRGEPGEQATLFVADPSGNALEFKAFRDMDQLFARG